VTAISSGASKGLSVIVLDERAMGGQAGALARRIFLALPRAYQDRPSLAECVSPLQSSSTRSVLGKASTRPELEDSQDPKRKRTVQNFLQRKLIIESHFAGRKSLL
jgi:hypothetical protein